MIKKFVWRDKYSVRVPSLDEQHKYFFSTANQILVLAQQPQTIKLKEKLIILLVKLGRYAFFHLDYEEECMKRFGCPGYEVHLEAHEAYRDRITQYLREVRDEDTDLPKLAEEIAEFSQNWLSNHILNKDREYVDCLVKNGVE